MKERCSMRKWVFIGIIVVVFGLMCMPCMAADDKIVFASNQEGNWDIYVMNMDGTGRTRLTDDPAQDWRPDWSPDG